MNDIYRKQVALLIRIMPSVKWKLQNITKLKTENPQKHQQGMEKLRWFFEKGNNVEH